MARTAQSSKGAATRAVDARRKDVRPVLAAAAKKMATGSRGLDSVTKQRIKRTLAEAAKKRLGDYAKTDEGKAYFNVKASHRTAFVNRTDELLRRRKKELLGRAERHGWSEQRTKKELEFELGLVVQSRANLAAQTEAIQDHNAGLAIQAKRDGMLLEWRSVRDSNTRPDHAKMHGTRIAPGESFKLPDGTELSYPGDPFGPAAQVVNCRCSVKLVKDPSAKKKPKPQSKKPPKAPAPPKLREVDSPTGSLRTPEATENIERYLARQELVSLESRIIQSGKVRTIDYDTLSEADRKTLKHITLFTNGYWPEVRNPDSWDPETDERDGTIASLPDAKTFKRWTEKIEREDLKAAKKYMEDLSAAPAAPISIYRGVRLKSEPKFEIGQEFEFDSITSFTTDENVARHFSGVEWEERKEYHSVIMRILNTKRGTDISKMSFHFHEKEFVTTGKARVIGTEIKDGVLYVDLEQ